MNLLERISHIIEIGGLDGMYKIYFKKGYYLEDENLYLNEQEFYVLDKLYNGELACKVEN